MGKSKKKGSMVLEDPDDAMLKGESGNQEAVKKASFWDQILLNRCARAAAGIFFFGILTPPLVYIFAYMTDYVVSGRSCAINDDFRIECIPGHSPSASQCRNAGCCWNGTNEPHCYHSLPSYHNYRRLDLSRGSNVSLEPLVRLSSVGTPLHPITLNVNPLSHNHLSLLLFDKGRYDGKVPNSGIDIHETAFEVKKFGGLDGKPPFSIEVLANGTQLLSTAEGPLVASDRYWVLSLKLPTSNVYGWGGAGIDGLGPPTLRLSRGPLPQWAGGGRRLAHPFLLCLSDDGRAHGILFRAAGPLEVDLLPSGLLTLRAVTNVWLEMHVLAGPTPAEVTRQVCEAVGYPQLPPYWALGLHVCRSDSSYAKDFFSNAEIAGLPFDSDCLGLRALGDRSFEIQPELVGEVKELKDELTRMGRKFLHVQYPQIEYWNYPAFEDGLEKDVFVKYGGLVGLYQGIYNGRAVVYPSLLKPLTQEWFTGILSQIQSLLGPIEAIAIEDDSPLSNGTFGKDPFPLDDLPFIPRGLNNSISQGTLWWMSHHSETILHYSIHNMYGYTFGENLSNALRKILQPITPGRDLFPRTLILGEWTQPGTGVFGGHGGAVRVPRSWTAMRSAFVSALANGLVGVPLSAGIAACGRIHTIEESEDYKSSPFDSSLCRRWINLGSILPLWRVHLPPGNISDGMMSTLTTAADLRYRLLPYIYTHMYHANLSGTPVARHLMFEYPEVKLARDADDQVLLGPALMVAPSFIPNSPTMEVFLPNGTWYSHPGGKKSKEVGKVVKYMLNRDEMPIFVRGGHIIPMQEHGTTAISSRKFPYGLLVALDCSENSTSSSAKPCAEGDLFVDDGITIGTVGRKDYELIKFVAPTSESVQLKRLNSWVKCNDVAFSTKIDSIVVYGAFKKPTGVVSVDGHVSPNATVTYYDTEMIKIEGIGADWCGLPEGGRVMKIEWM